MQPETSIKITSYEVFNKKDLIENVDSLSSHDTINQERVTTQATQDDTLAVPTKIASFFINNYNGSQNINGVVTILINDEQEEILEFQISKGFMGGQRIYSVIFLNNTH